MPVHELMQSAHLMHNLVSRAQVQMIGVAKLHLALQIFKIDGRDSAFDGCGSSYIHKEWCLNGAVYSFKDASSGISFGFKSVNIRVNSFLFYPCVIIGGVCSNVQISLANAAIRVSFSSLEK